MARVRDGVEHIRDYIRAFERGVRKGQIPLIFNEPNGLKSLEECRQMGLDPTQFAYGPRCTKVARATLPPSCFVELSNDESEEEQDAEPHTEKTTKSKFRHRHKLQDLKLRLRRTKTELPKHLPAKPRQNPLRPLPPITKEMSQAGWRGAHTKAQMLQFIETTGGNRANWLATKAVDLAKECSRIQRDHRVEQQRQLAATTAHMAIQPVPKPKRKRKRGESGAGESQQSSTDDMLSSQDDAAAETARPKKKARFHAHNH
ncbi:hypothetical protein EJ04DRAFT_560147 [Polyplosphaeria fusca]|uniref:Uncharacterized protein n=1 Tax=Polyplosphaeria fusca TaxID=682080 RepID=A0A9P4R523_9PLEO|nr:hypothetical protein EJ04DRAFT_560147 [Polyplosphaeria fusca]